MKLITAWDYKYAPLAAITVPPKILHAGKFEWDFVSETYKNLNGSWWERVEHCKKHLPGSGWIFINGADAAFTNPDFDSRSLLDDNADLIIACDGNGLNAEVFFMRECDACHWLLDEWLARRYGSHDQDDLAFILGGVPAPDAPIPVTHGWFPCWNHIDFLAYRQNGFYCNPRQLEAGRIAFNKTRVRVKIVEQRVLNAYPVEYYGQSPQDWSWHPGDFIAHAVGKSMEERCKILGDLQKK